MRDLQSKFQEIWGNFGILKNFWTKKQGFFAFARELQITKSLHLWICHEKLGFLVHGQEIWEGFEPSKGQKTLKNDLTAHILTHRKQSW